MNERGGFDYAGPVELIGLALLVLVLELRRHRWMIWQMHGCRWFTFWLGWPYLPLTDAFRGHPVLGPRTVREGSFRHRPGR